MPRQDPPAPSSILVKAAAVGHFGRAFVGANSRAPARSVPTCRGHLHRGEGADDLPAILHASLWLLRVCLGKSNFDRGGAGAAIAVNRPLPPALSTTGEVSVVTPCPPPSRGPPPSLISVPYGSACGGGRVWRPPPHHVQQRWWASGRARPPPRLCHRSRLWATMRGRVRPPPPAPPGQEG